jgi:hypothetical protein
MGKYIYILIIYIVVDPGYHWVYGCIETAIEEKPPMFRMHRVPYYTLMLDSFFP